MLSVVEQLSVCLQSGSGDAAAAGDKPTAGQPERAHHAKLDISRVGHGPAVPASAAAAAAVVTPGFSDSDGSDSGEEGGRRREAGIFEGVVGGTQQQVAAARQPFGTSATTHRRRAGGVRAAGAAPRTPRERAAALSARSGAPDTSSVFFTNVVERPAAATGCCDSPAPGFTALTDAQLGVLRQMFDSVDW